jgi:hypothetical protein
MPNHLSTRPRRQRVEPLHACLVGLRLLHEGLLELLDLRVREALHLPVLAQEDGKLVDGQRVLLLDLVKLIETLEDGLLRHHVPEVGEHGRELRDREALPRVVLLPMF